MKHFGRNCYLSCFYTLLYLPIMVVIWLSFNQTRYSLVWQGFTWKWYTTLAQDHDLIHVAINSLIVGISAASIATMIAAITSISLFRYRFTGKAAISNLIFVMIIAPDIVIAISLLLLFRFLDIPLGFWTLLLAHITFCIPFAVVTINSRLNGLNRCMIEAAQDLGAKEHTIFFRILLPLIAPGLIAGWLLSFTLSLDDVIISYFVTGPSFDILPLKIFAMVKLGVSPEVNALSTILFALTLIVVVISQLIMRKNRAKTH